MAPSKAAAAPQRIFKLEMGAAAVSEGLVKVCVLTAFRIPLADVGKVVFSATVPLAVPPKLCAGDSSSPSLRYSTLRFAAGLTTEWK